MRIRAGLHDYLWVSSLRFPISRMPRNRSTAVDADAQETQTGNAGFPITAPIGTMNVQISAISRTSPPIRKTIPSVRRASSSLSKRTPLKTDKTARMYAAGMIPHSTIGRIMSAAEEYMEDAGRLSFKLHMTWSQSAHAKGSRNKTDMETIVLILAFLFIFTLSETASRPGLSVFSLCGGSLRYAVPSQ